MLSIGKRVWSGLACDGLPSLCYCSRCAYQRVTKRRRTVALQKFLKLLRTSFTSYALRYAGAAAVVVTSLTMVAATTDAFAISCAMRSTWTFHAVFIRSVEAHLNVSDVARHHYGLFERRSTASNA